MLRKLGLRHFHGSLIRFKTKDQYGGMLKNLGVPMKNDKTDKPEMDEEGKDEPMDSKLKDYYDSIAYMSSEDVIIQKNLDEGKPFQSFESEHYLDRKKLLKSLPNEIDIVDTPLPEIEKIYKNLNKLDKDKSVQLKYYKRYLNDYSDPINLLLQEFNGIDEKFRLLRRNEIDNLSLNPNSYLYKENLFNLPYNVVGFDRSISGFPLRMGKHKLTDVCYPQEFIQDLSASQRKIKLHKKDLDFVEYNENSLSINPHNLKNHYFNNKTLGANNHQNNNLDNYPDGNGKSINRVIDMIYNELDFPRNFLMINDIDDYKVLKFKFLNKFNSIIETEINTLKASLQKEIELLLSSNNQSNNLLLFNHQFFKTNQYKLCDLIKHDSKLNEDNFNDKPTVMVVSYNTQLFNMIPYHYLLPPTRRSKTKLFKHLFKLFLINLNDQIETLQRIKYANKKSVFINNLNLKISNIIKFKLINLFYSINDLKQLKFNEPIAFKPYNTKHYKRLYNYRLPYYKYGKLRRRSHFKSSTWVSAIDLEQLL